MPEPSRVLFTQQEVADKTKSSLRTIQRLVKNGKLDAVKFSDRGIRISQESLDRFLSKLPTVFRKPGAMEREDFAAFAGERIVMDAVTGNFSSDPRDGGRTNL